jgi:hypothetical protein
VLQAQERSPAALAKSSGVKSSPEIELAPDLASEIDSDLPVGSGTLAFSSTSTAGFSPSSCGAIACRGGGSLLIKLYTRTRVFTVTSHEIQLNRETWKKIAFPNAVCQVRSILANGTTNKRWILPALLFRPGNSAAVVHKLGTSLENHRYSCFEFAVAVGTGRWLWSAGK